MSPASRVHGLRRTLGLVALVLASASGRAVAQSRDARLVARELQSAVREKDIDAFLTAFERLLAEDDRRTLKTALEGYAELSERLSRKHDLWSELHRLHNRCARALGQVEGKEGLEEIRRLRARTRSDWRERLLVLDASALHPQLDLGEASLAALEDPAPQVIRRSLRYLRNSRKVSVLEEIVSRYVEVERKEGRKGDREWNRTILAFQASLAQMLHVDLPQAVDYQSYVSAHKDRADLFEPKETSSSTGLTLFGAAVTGKNIAFVLDVSGSMLTTDPLSRGKDGRERGRTVVVDPAKGGSPEELLEERRRMTRAKKELARVVRALPSDVRFNLITYSSGVRPWREAMARADDKAKKEAVEYIAELRAEGITVTDYALEEAFADLDIDTIYLLTDGAPTHIGTRGPGLPPDAAQLIAEIHRRVGELNFLRDVRIFTLGFVGAEENFLKKLAAENGGRYVAIE